MNPIQHTPLMSSHGPLRALSRFRGSAASNSTSTNDKATNLRNVYCESPAPSPLGPPTLFQWNTGWAWTSRRLNRLALGLGARLGRVTFEGEGRRRVVVLGTGWAAVNFLRTVDPRKFEVVVVSPRDYFTFSPLLPSVCGGTLSGRSTMEPIRDLTIIGGKKTIEFYEATAESIDIKNKKILCRGVNDGAEFEVTYNFLVYSVGAETNTFGIPGVEANAHFLKEVEHAEAIHNKVLDNFETANLPTASLDDKRKLLHFVVVGGGPTGVETAAEISDFVLRDAKRHYPHLTPLVQISIIEMLPKLLPTFDPKISKFTADNFRANMPNIRLCLNTTVTGVTDTEISVKQKLANGPEQISSLPYGLLLWASGVGQVPLSKKLMTSIDTQRNGRWISVDGHLRLVGAPDVFALGDCAMISPERPSERAEDLYKIATTSPMGAGTSWLEHFQTRLATWRFPHLDRSFVDFKIIDKRDNLSLDAFRAVLKDVENTYRPPIPTAQNAKQAGQFLGVVFNDVIKGSPTAEGLELPVYCPKNQGQLAYVGNNRGVGQVNLKLGKYFDRQHLIMGGVGSGMFWKSVYWGMSYSAHNMWLQGLEYARVAFRGRDSGRAHLVERKKIR